MPRSRRWTTSAPENVFGREDNEALVHQIVVAYQANARRVRALKGQTDAKHSTRKRGAKKGPAARGRE